MIEMSPESFEKLWLLVLINNFSGVTGYKIQLQKSIVFLYITNEQPASKISIAIQFTIALKRIKYWINVTKEVHTCALKTIKHG